MTSLTITFSLADIQEQINGYADGIGGQVLYENVGREEPEVACTEIDLKHELDIFQSLSMIQKKVCA